MPHPFNQRNASRSSLPHLRTAALALVAGLALALGAGSHPAASTPAGTLGQTPGPVVEATSADSNSADDIDLGRISPEAVLFSDSNSADDIDLGATGPEGTLVSDSNSADDVDLG